MPRRHHDLIVIGCSSGGVPALKTIARALPGNLRAAVLVVLHLSPAVPSHLDELLRRAGPLRAVQPKDRELLEEGKIYVAPPDRHLLVEPRRIRLSHGPKENQFRPAVDPLFRSAALAYGPRVIGVVLTGSLDDGAAGLHAVKSRGGIAIVQDPRDAEFPSMPECALRATTADYCASLDEIGPLLRDLVGRPAARPDKLSASNGLATEARFAEMRSHSADALRRIADPTSLACPECSGPLWEMHGTPLPRYRCHVGHAYGAMSLQAAQAEDWEASLWRVLRSNDERIALLDELSRRARESGGNGAVLSGDLDIRKLERFSTSIHGLLAGGRAPEETPRSLLRGSGTPT